MVRSENEIKHGQMLAKEETELLWGWGTPAGQQRARRRSKLISDGAKLGFEKKALEIGCGTGLFTEYFAQTNVHITSVDISSDLLQKAMERNLPKDQVQFLEMPFEKLENKIFFDAVIGSSILHHLDIKPALKKIYNLLKPGGYISFAEPNMMNPQVFAMFKFRKYFPEISPDENAFLRWKLNKMLVEAGFEEIKIIPFDWLHPNIPECLIPFVSSLSRIFEKTPIVKEFAGSLYIGGRRPFKKQIGLI